MLPLSAKFEKKKNKKNVGLNFEIENMLPENEFCEL